MGMKGFDGRIDASLQDVDAVGPRKKAAKSRNANVLDEATRIVREYVEQFESVPA